MADENAVVEAPVSGESSVQNLEIPIVKDVDIKKEALAELTQKVGKPVEKAPEKPELSTEQIEAKKAAFAEQEAKKAEAEKITQAKTEEDLKKEEEKAATKKEEKEADKERRGCCKKDFKTQSRTSRRQN